MDIPAFHPEWLITFWLTTPVIRDLNAHLVTIILVSAVLVMIYVKKKKQVINKPDGEEDEFKRLILKKSIIEQKLQELKEQHNSNEVTDNEYVHKEKELIKYLNQTNEQLKKFTL